MKKNIKKTLEIEESMEEDTQQYTDYDSKNFNILRVDNELFDDDSYVPGKILNVKLVNLPKQGTDWHVLQDNKIVLVVKGTKLTKAEKDFLLTPNGMIFLMNEFKSGTTSLFKLKQRIKAVKL